MKKIVFSAALTAALITGGAATAQDQKQFDGLYGGLEAGVDWTKLAGDLKRDRSFYYGGVIGLRRQLDNGLVTGLEGTFGDSGYRNNAAGISASYEWSTSLLVGTAFGDGGNLLFGKAGYVETRFNPAGADNSFNNGGWRFGGGYERALGQNLSFRLGGDYTTYGNDVGQWQAKGGLLLKF